RVGDTGRWKGENVSTGEVTAVLSACPGVSDAVVYAVPVPGTEGRAGMAAVVVAAQFELAALRRHLQALPAYARPLFIRIVPAIELTGTFRLKKGELARQGYDPARVSDPVYFDDRSLEAYVRVDGALYERLRAGSLRLQRARRAPSRSWARVGSFTARRSGQREDRVGRRRIT